MTSKVEEIITQLKSLTLLEAADLVQQIETTFNVSATASVSSISVAAPSSVGAVQEVEEKTEFDVILKEIGGQKLKLIKKVKELRNLGLVEAKVLVESAPCRVLEKVSKENASQFKTELEILGATIEIK